MAADIELLKGLLEKVDAAEAECPIAKGLSADTCPKCRATSSQNCGPWVSAAHWFFKDARPSIEALQAERDGLKATCSAVKEAFHNTDAKLQTAEAERDALKARVDALEAGLRLSPLDAERLDAILTEAAASDQFDHWDGRQETINAIRALLTPQGEQL